MSKSKILSAIRNNKPEATQLPEIPDFRYETLNLERSFKSNAEKSKATFYPSGTKIETLIATQFATAKNIAAPTLPELATLEIIAESPVEALKQVDLAILRGVLGVAENGAIWVPEKNTPHRVLPFITQHLVLLLSKADIVYNMHEAYKKINLLDNGFGVFIAGPSKTADIEQSLVIGAQGARTLGVCWI